MTPAREACYFKPSAPTIGPVVANSWYPGDAAALRSRVETLVSSTRRDGSVTNSVPTAGVKALVVPHAGFEYSGSVAAHGFAALAGHRPTRVLLVGPSHYAAFDGAAIPDCAGYATPLGAVPLDTAAISRLIPHPVFRVDSAPYMREHSLEAELPFLQTVLSGEWRLVPLLIGARSSRKSLRQIAIQLRTVFDENTRIVISSDFTHFGSRFAFVPFSRDIPREIRRLDQGAIDRILGWDLEAYETYLKDTAATICGRDAIHVLLRMFPLGLQGRLAAYDTSGRITGDSSHSVSYASLVFGSGE